VKRGDKALPFTAWSPDAGPGREFLVSLDFEELSEGVVLDSDRRWAEKVKSLASIFAEDKIRSSEPSVISSYKYHMEAGYTYFQTFHFVVR
jgi:hypothetical protein